MKQLIVYLGLSLIAASALCVSWRHVFAEVGGTKVVCARALSLEEFRAVAFEQSPLVAQIDSEYAQQVARAFETEVLANPEVQAEQVYTRMNMGGNNDPQANISFGLPLRLSNFGTRGRVASLMKKAGDTHKRLALLELSQKVALQFYSLRSLQLAEQIISDTESRVSRQASLMKDGVKKGLVSEGDQKLFDGERYRLLAQKRGLQSALFILRAEMGKSIGLACPIEAQGGSRKLPDIPAEEALVETAQRSELSDSSRLELLNSLAQEQLRLAELDAIPEMSPRLVYQHTNDGGDFFGLGVALPLPLFNRNQAAIGRAHAEKSLVQSKRRFLAQGGLQSQIRMLRASVVALSDQSQIYESKVVPAFREALYSQERLYAQGKGSVSQLWQTLRTCSDAQRESLGVWIQALSARMQLSLLVGEEI